VEIEAEENFQSETFWRCYFDDAFLSIAVMPALAMEMVCCSMACSCDVWEGLDIAGFDECIS